MFRGFAQRRSYVIYGTALPDCALSARLCLTGPSEAVHHTERCLRSSRCGTVEHPCFSTWDSGACFRFLIPHFPPQGSLGRILIFCAATHQRRGPLNDLSDCRDNGRFHFTTDYTIRLSAWRAPALMIIQSVPLAVTDWGIARCGLNTLAVLPVSTCRMG